MSDSERRNPLDDLPPVEEPPTFRQLIDLLNLQHAITLAAIRTLAVTPKANEAIELSTKVIALIIESPIATPAARRAWLDAPVEITGLEAAGDE